MGNDLDISGSMIQQPEEFGHFGAVKPVKPVTVAMNREVIEILLFVP